VLNHPIVLGEFSLFNDRIFPIGKPVFFLFHNFITLASPRLNAFQACSMSNSTGQAKDAKFHSLPAR
jgi:hypothetical protein